MKQGVLFIISGPSGTGKGTICNELLKQEKMFLSVSNTTRERRVGEIDGVTYNYVSVEEFERQIDKGGFLEYAKYGSNYYGTPREPVESRLQRGENVLLEIEPQGALKVKQQISDAVMIFIIPPSMKELKKRLEERGRETKEQIDERMEASKWEFSKAAQYNFICVNDKLDECVERVRAIIHDTVKERGLIENLLKENY
ncbi:MAG: guanylate kinase [Clostridiales bacterium]|nr:guanylate kinase [Clostridiales bacterium]